MTRGCTRMCASIPAPARHDESFNMLFLIKVGKCDKMPRFAGDAQAYAAHMISPAAVISLCDDIVQRTMISSHCSDFGTFHLSIRCGCPHPTVIPSVAWESSRQAHFAPLDCHVATFVALRNDKEELNCCALYLRQFTSFPFQEILTALRASG